MNIKLLFGLIPVVIKKQKMNKKLLFGLIPVLVIALLIPAALTSDGYLTSFEKTYPGAAGSSIDSCELCHINPSGGGPLNPYGTDFANNSHNFTAIESNDSDGDGFTNIVEINARTFPGNALDNPLTLKQTALDGATLYSSYCSSCHNPLTSSSKLGATAAQIQIAINTVPEMKSLSSLRMAQLHAISTALVVTTTSSPTTALDRAALYASYCQGCHNSLATSTKKGRTLDQIKSSISNVQAMKSLSFLNPAQIQGIAIALGASLTSTSTSNNPEGAALYAGNCAGCHNSLASTTKRGRTVAQIQNAINTVPGMSSLSSLGAGQIQAIAAALPPALAPMLPPDLTTTLDGPTLYDNFCASCHQPLASTTKPGRSADQITSAINTVPGMSSLTSLSAAQIDAIAAILPATTQTTTNLTTDGTALYTGNCAGCHNPLATTTKARRTATLIQNAIYTVPDMSVDSSLTSAQIAAIATALAVSPSSTTTPPNGATLYNSYCSSTSCHGPLATTNKPGRTATQIQNAINTVGAMSSLTSLTSAQITAIAAALPAPASTTTPPTGAALYTTYCSSTSCHGPLATTNKPGRTATQIQNAINTVSQMSSLTSLTSAQIASIAAALPSAPTDGASLYASYCSSCHHPLASSDVKRSSASTITSRIRSVNEMNSISLTSAQITAIANALATA